MPLKLRLNRDQVECLLDETTSDSRAALVAYLGDLCKDWLDMETALSKTKRASRRLPKTTCDEDLGDK